MYLYLSLNPENNYCSVKTYSFEDIKENRNIFNDKDFFVFYVNNCSLLNDISKIYNTLFYENKMDHQLFYRFYYRIEMLIKKNGIINKCGLKRAVMPSISSIIDDLKYDYNRILICKNDLFLINHQNIQFKFDDAYYEELVKDKANYSKEEIFNLWTYNYITRESKIFYNIFVGD